MSKKVGIRNGYYGVFTTDKKGNTEFKKVGKEIRLTSIKRNIETKDFFLMLKYKYLGQYEEVEVSREALYDMSTVGKHVAKGIDISKKTADIAIDSIRMQEDWFAKKGYAPANVYEKLGWTRLENSQKVKACFRSYELIGDSGTYIGDYKIAPMGSFEAWRQMVINDVLGDTTLELILLASLSSVIVTLVTPINDPGNPIMHVYGVSGCGKSTGLELGTSTAGEPFDGDKITTDSDGTPKSTHSIYRSWSATVNALIGSCAGNKGYPIILNELGKCQANDLTTLVYNISEGTDKLRYSKDMKASQSEGYSTSFISAGEHSLLDRCKDKSDGLRVRVLELEMTKAPNGAARADRIKATCKKHNGHALPMVAKYILTNIGFKGVQELYNKNLEECLKVWTPSPSYERFVSKFVAIYLTTADIAAKALDIPFNKDAIRDFLCQYDKQNGSKRNSALSSYDILMEEFAKNQHKFIDKEGNVPKNECWGKIEHCKRQIDKNKVLVERILVFRSEVERLLKQNGFNNFDTCYRAWKDEGLIDYEKDKNTRKRKIYPLSDKKYPVFVFNVFEDPTKPESNIVYNQNKNLLTEEVVTDDIDDAARSC